MNKKGYWALSNLLIPYADTPHTKRIRQPAYSIAEDGALIEPPNSKHISVSSPSTSSGNASTDGSGSINSGVESGEVKKKKGSKDIAQNECPTSTMVSKGIIAYCDCELTIVWKYIYNHHLSFA